MAATGEEKKLIIQSLLKLLNEQGEESFEGPYQFGVQSDNVFHGEDKISLAKILGGFTEDDESIKDQLDALRNNDFSQLVRGDVYITNSLFVNKQKVVADIVSKQGKGYAPKADVSEASVITQKGILSVDKDGKVNWTQVPGLADESNDGWFSAEQYSKLKKVKDVQDQAVLDIKNLKTGLEAEISRATTEEERLDDAVNAESSARETADSALDVRVSAIEGKIPTAATSVNQLADKKYVTDAIGTEAARAKAAEEANVSNITALTGRVSTNETHISTIESKIPSNASATNQLADKDFVNSSLNNIAAYYITKDTSGNAFATKAELTATTTFYCGGQIRVPTRNDYCIVLADESHKDAVTGTSPTTRYIYNNGWEFQYVVNNSPFTAAQWATITSGATAALIAQITTNKNEIDAIKLVNTTQGEDISGLKTRMTAVENKNTTQDNLIQTLTDIANSAIQTGTGSNGIKVTKSGTELSIAGITAATNTIGVAYLHKAEDCTTYSSDNGGATPAAIKKAITTESTQTNDLFNATSAHRGTMSKEDKIKLDKFGEASTYATKTELNTLNENLTNLGLSIDEIEQIANNAMPKSGGTFTGNIAVTGGASISTSGYVTGTWLATTAATNLGVKPEKIAVIGTQGSAKNYIYYRTPDEIRSDIGAASTNDLKKYLPLTGGTLSGDLTVNADVYTGHQFIIPANNTAGRGMGIYETKDTTNLFGFLSSDTNHVTLNVGATGKELAFRGKNTRPTYNGNNLALYTDANAKYTKPSTGIPVTDLSKEVQDALNVSGDYVTVTTDQTITGTKTFTKGIKTQTSDDTLDFWGFRELADGTTLMTQIGGWGTDSNNCAQYLMFTTQGVEAISIGYVVENGVLTDSGLNIANTQSSFTKYGADRIAAEAEVYAIVTHKHFSVTFTDDSSEQYGNTGIITVNNYSTTNYSHQGNIIQLWGESKSLDSCNIYMMALPQDDFVGWSVTHYGVEVITLGVINTSPTHENTNEYYTPIITMGKTDYTEDSINTAKDSYIIQTGARGTANSIKGLGRARFEFADQSSIKTATSSSNDYGYYQYAMTMDCNRPTSTEDSKEQYRFTNGLFQLFSNNKVGDTFNIILVGAPQDGAVGLSFLCNGTPQLTFGISNTTSADSDTEQYCTPSITTTKDNCNINVSHGNINITSHDYETSATANIELKPTGNKNYEYTESGITCYAKGRDGKEYRVGLQNNADIGMGLFCEDSDYWGFILAVNSDVQVIGDHMVSLYDEYNNHLFLFPKDESNTSVTIATREWVQENGGATPKLYRHNITLKYTSGSNNIAIIFIAAYMATSTRLTSAEQLSTLYNILSTSGNYVISCSGYYSGAPVIGIAITSSQIKIITTGSPYTEPNNLSGIALSNFSISDWVSRDLYSIT